MTSYGETINIKFVSLDGIDNFVIQTFYLNFIRVQNI